MLPSTEQLNEIDKLMPPGMAAAAAMVTMGEAAAPAAAMQADGEAATSAAARRPRLHRGCVKTTPEAAPEPAPEPGRAAAGVGARELRDGEDLQDVPRAESAPSIKAAWRVRSARGAGARRAPAAPEAAPGARGRDVRVVVGEDTPAVADASRCWPSCGKRSYVAAANRASDRADGALRG